MREEEKLNTMKSFKEEGFKIGRDGKVITLDFDEMFDFIYLQKANEGRRSLLEYKATASLDGWKRRKGMNRINLYFDKSLSHIAENSYGQEVYLNQIKDKLKLDEENEIYFPIQIKGVSISFIQGLIKDLVNTYGKEKVLQLITLKSDNEMLQERLNRNIKF